mmetsp:Transcript_53075/g.130128  ORF Transcript_53075/g.130128 Transcript_53075/m.130128 type:complete len:225 (-) Transcript_53075:107-781(-)
MVLHFAVVPVEEEVKITFCLCTRRISTLFTLHLRSLFEHVPDLFIPIPQVLSAVLAPAAYTRGHFGLHREHLHRYLCVDGVSLRESTHVGYHCRRLPSGQRRTQGQHDQYNDFRFFPSLLGHRLSVVPDCRPIRLSKLRGLSKFNVCSSRSLDFLMNLRVPGAQDNRYEPVVCSRIGFKNLLAVDWAHACHSHFPLGKFHVRTVSSRRPDVAGSSCDGLSAEYA